MMKNHREIIRRLYEDGWGKGDLTAIDEVFASEHVLHWHELKLSDQHRSVAEVKKIVQAYRAAIPDLQVIIDDVVVEDDKAAVQVTFIGTHQGEYEGYPPTHKRGRFTDVQILRFEKGKIVESSLASGGLRYFFAMLDGTLFEA
ncbi:MAG: ester cyclase [Chloroflexi bacterium]|nr:ester cyclase [Chloroflexota bacterium]